MTDDGLEKQVEGNGLASRHRYHFDSEDGKLNTQNWGLSTSTLAMWAENRLYSSLKLKNLDQVAMNTRILVDPAYFLAIYCNSFFSAFGSPSRGGLSNYQITIRGEPEPGAHESRGMTDT